MNLAYRDYGYQSADQGWSYHYLMPPLRKLLGPPKGAILDLGCGNGAVAHALLDEGYDVYGVDASETGIAIAAKNLPGRFYVLDLTSGQLPPELANISFSTVISTEVIEHLYAPREFVKLARDLLPEDGEFILSTPYHGYLKNLALALTGKLDAHFTVLWDGGHIKFFSRRTLEKLLSESGFSVMQFVGAGRWPYLWKSMLVKAKAI